MITTILSSAVRKTGPFLFLFILYNSCTPKPYIPQTFANIAITLTGIFPQCHNPTSSSSLITYSGSVQVYYFNSRGSDRQPGSLVNFTSGTNPGNPVVVNASIPSDGSHYQLEVVVQGTKCSTCALTQFGPDICNQVATIDSTGNFPAHTAAKPRKDLLYGTFVSYQSTISLNLSGQPLSPNVPNSCNCSVPD